MVSLKRSGIADLPLHYGTTPPWLFKRMVRLARGIIKSIVLEYGREEFLKRVSDPFWFQSFSCVLGWDFHSSGTTTVTCGAIKEAINASELGMGVVGGKGKASRKTPEEIERIGEEFGFSSRRIERLKYASKIIAKVDNTALQDGFQLYHHTFILTEDGKYAVIQQGMNPQTKFARRYHWFSEKISSFVEEPHAGIFCPMTTKPLNLVAKESEETRKCCVDLVNDNPIHLAKYLGFGIYRYLKMPKQHWIKVEDYRGIMKKLEEAYEQKPRDFEELLGIKGIGPKTIRALALISHLIYGTKLSWKDPITFSFAHGGKDGHPYPINKRRYDKTLQILEDAVKNAEVGRKEKLYALKRLKEVLPLNK